MHEKYGLGEVKHLNATGGGAYKFAELAKRELGVEFVQHDEMQCLVRGMNYVLQHSDRELFYVREDEPDTRPQAAPASSSPSSSSSTPAPVPPLQLPAIAAVAAASTASATVLPSPKLASVAGAAPAPKRDLPTVPAEQVFVPTSGRQNLYPYLVVNVGSGVSVLKITGPESFERVSGSGIGGGTFWGLTRLLTGFTDFAQVIEQCQPGQADEGQVDFLVRDVYGSSGVSPIGLDPTLTASYFGKVQRNGTRKYRDADVAKSLLHMVSDNVAEVGWLVSEIQGTELVVFSGGFVLDNQCVWQLITKSMRYWSHGTRKALFLAHDGYLGALGALLTQPPPTKD